MEFNIVNFADTWFEWSTSVEYKCFDFRQKPVQAKKEEKETQKPPCTEVKRFAEVDASVVDVFKAPVDAPFSLGALFGTEESSDEEAESQPGKWLLFNHFSKIIFF